MSTEQKAFFETLASRDIDRFNAEKVLWDSFVAETKALEKESREKWFSAEGDTAYAREEWEKYYGDAFEIPRMWNARGPLN